jgi:hypothetical protein
MDTATANVFVRNYVVHGLKLTLHSRERELMEQAETLLAPFVYNDSSAAACRIHLDYAEIPQSCSAPNGLQFFGKGTYVKGIEQYCWTSTRCRYLLMPGIGSLHLDHDQSLARVQVSPGMAWSLAIGLLLPALAEFLREHGQHVIHSAVVAAKQGNTEKALLITGQSGSGKSSSALAFAGSGFKLLADDTAFITVINDRFTAWGLPLACKVHENTLRLLPWLSNYPRGAALIDHEFSMDLCSDLGPGATARAEPQAMIFLDQRNPETHIIEPIDKFDAVKLFCDDNLRRLDMRGHGHSGAAFRLFGRLVAACQTLRVSAGPDLAGLPHAVLAHLQWTIDND